MADLEEAARDAKSIARWPMGLVVLGIVLNFALLVIGTVVPECVVSLGWSGALILASVGPYLIGLAALWLTAWYKFAAVTKQVEATHG